MCVCLLLWRSWNYQPWWWKDNYRCKCALECAFVMQLIGVRLKFGNERAIQVTCGISHCSTVETANQPFIYYTTWTINVLHNGDSHEQVHQSTRLSLHFCRKTGTGHGYRRIKYNFYSAAVDLIAFTVPGISSESDGLSVRDCMFRTKLFIDSFLSPVWRFVWVGNFVSGVSVPGACLTFLFCYFSFSLF